jgi:hypothetical protein
MNYVPHVVYGDTPSIFDRLENPQTMGAVLQGAFSARVLSAARKISSRPLYNTPGRWKTPLIHALDAADDHPAIGIIREAHERAKDWVSGVGARLLRTTGIFDDARIEPSIGDQFARNTGPWHVDGVGKIAGIGVPFGITTEYLPVPIPGKFEGNNFVPDEPDQANRIALCLGNKDFAIFKIAGFPYEPEVAQPGFIHRRPNAKLETIGKTSRLLNHYRLL